MPTPYPIRFSELHNHPAYQAGYDHGSTPGKVFDPEYKYDTNSHVAYTQGFADARNGRERQ